MTELTTLFSTNIPVEGHILKGRLETEGIPCFIFDEHRISVHLSRAVAIDGVKLKVPVDCTQHLEYDLPPTHNSVTASIF